MFGMQDQVEDHFESLEDGKHDRRQPAEHEIGTTEAALATISIGWVRSADVASRWSSQ